jgi:RNA polymerase sigma factor (sigma-70 family)
VEGIKGAHLAQLMARAQSGDREALHTLLKDIGSFITRSLRRRLPDIGDIEDTCQQVLVAVYKSRHTYQSDRPFEPWLFAIIGKVTGPHLRRDQKRLAVQIQLDELPELCNEGTSSGELELREALKQLSPAHLDALALTKLRGLSVDEVRRSARRTGTSASSMKVQVHRAYQSLKRSLLS